MSGPVQTQKELSTSSWGSSLGDRSGSGYEFDLDAIALQARLKAEVDPKLATGRGFSRTFIALKTDSPASG